MPTLGFSFCISAVSQKPMQEWVWKAAAAASGHVLMSKESMRFCENCGEERPGTLRQKFSELCAHFEALPDLILNGAGDGPRPSQQGAALQPARSQQEAVFLIL